MFSNVDNWNAQGIKYLSVLKDDAFYECVLKFHRFNSIQNNDQQLHSISLLFITLKVFTLFTVIVIRVLCWLEVRTELGTFTFNWVNTTPIIATNINSHLEAWSQCPELHQYHCMPLLYRLMLNYWLRHLGTSLKLGILIQYTILMKNGGKIFP